MSLKLKIEVEISGTGDCPKSLKFSEKSLRKLPIPNRSLEGLKVDYQLNDDVAATFMLQGVDDMGNPTNSGLGTPTVSSISDPTVVSATINADNSLTITPLKLGTSQVVVTDTAGANTITGQLNVTVVSTDAVTFNFVPSSTAPLPPPAQDAAAKKPSGFNHP